jgi:hypothetical protein
MDHKIKYNKEKRSPVQGWREAEAVEGCQGAVVSLCLSVSLVLA